MPRDILSEQQINIEFVKAVQKHPTLYNFELPSYSRKDISDQAWEDVGKATNMTPSACRERWRNLRAVFMRTIKACAKSTGKKKPYYLADVMQFVVPYMRPLAAAEVAKEKQKLSRENEANKPTQPKEETDKTVLVEVEQIKVEKIDEDDSDGWSSQSIDEVKDPRKRPAQDTEEYVPNKVVAQIAQLAQPSPSVVPTDIEHVKSFLNSLVPELNEMNSTQFKNFKRRVLLLIDDIMTEIPSNTRQLDDSEYIL